MSAFNQDNQWLAVDLGLVFEVRSVQITWAATYARDYKILGSTDCKVWTSLSENVAGHKGSVNTLLPRCSRARYVCIFCLVRATAFGFGIAEMRVHGAVPAELADLAEGQDSNGTGAAAETMAEHETEAVWATEVQITEAAASVETEAAGRRVVNNVDSKHGETGEITRERAVSWLNPLPSETVAWDAHLWLCTGGGFDPRTAVFYNCWLGSSPREVCGRVSVLTPTTESRTCFHKLLWECFEAQDWEDKELVVVETFITKPSQFLVQMAAHHPHLVYIGLKSPYGSTDLSIGLKRNIGIRVASGELIAHFDDDDLYAPNYLGTMQKELQHAQVIALTLSTWFVLDMRTGDFSFCDPALALQEVQLVKEMQYGWGFSYFYHKKAALSVPFDDERSMGEDYDFYSRLADYHGPKSVALMRDEQGICLHIQHKNPGQEGANTSDSNICKFRDVTRSEIANLEFNRCPGFRMYFLLSSILAQMNFSYSDSSDANHHNMNFNLHTLTNVHEQWAHFASVLEENATRRYFIAGDWDDWEQLHEMVWNPKIGCLTFEPSQECRTEHSFQIFMDGSWSRCIHPGEPNAGPAMPTDELCGPHSADYHGLNWTIKCPTVQHTQFCVRVELGKDFRIRSVYW